MMKTRLAFACLAAILTLTACGEEKGPGGLSREEERDLDNAASMLDNSGTIAVPDDSLVANEAEIQAEEGAPAANESDGNGQ